MEEALRRILHDYLAGTVGFDEMTDWVARNIWDAPNVGNSLVDRIAHLLAFLDDSLLSEDEFREEVRSLIPNIVLHLYVPDITTEATVSPPTHDRIVMELVGVP